MLKALRTSAMLLALVGSATAGEILTPPAPKTPQPQGITVQEPTSDGYNNNDAPYTLTAIALDLIAVLPSLL